MARLAPEEEIAPRLPYRIPPGPNGGTKSWHSSERRTTMAVTMAQALAERVRYQTSHGEKVLQAAGEQSHAVFGNPEDVLTVRGNVSDIAHTNHLWLLDAVAAGAVAGTLPQALQRPRPLGIDDALAFLAPRDRKSTRLNSSHANISYAVFCLKK